MILTATSLLFASLVAETTLPKVPCPNSLLTTTADVKWKVSVCAVLRARCKQPTSSLMPDDSTRLHDKVSLLVARRGCFCWSCLRCGSLLRWLARALARGHEGRKVVVGAARRRKGARRLTPRSA